MYGYIMVTVDNRPAAPAVSWRARLKVRRETVIGWLFVLPALLMYTVFVLVPFLLTILYSFFRWNGVGPMTWVGIKNYMSVFQSPNLIGTILNAFWLVLWFSFIPVGLGLIVASVIHRVAIGRFGAVARPFCSCPRSSRSSLPASSGVGCWPSRA
jgi:raffinose/stachyose/melibiose transport system permease protein